MCIRIEAPGVRRLHLARDKHWEMNDWLNGVDVSGERRIELSITVAKYLQSWSLSFRPAVKSLAELCFLTVPAELARCDSVRLNEKWF